MTNKQFRILEETNEQLIKVAKEIAKVSEKTVDMLEEDLTEIEINLLAEVSKNADRMLCEVQTALQNTSLLARMGNNQVN